VAARPAKTRSSRSSFRATKQCYIAVYPDRIQGSPDATSEIFALPATWVDDLHLARGRSAPTSQWPRGSLAEAPIDLDNA
jgi:hypothetical protein